MVFEFGNRWYDQNPKISVAVGCIEEADPELRKKLAKVIIKKAMEKGVKAKKPTPGFFRRWYDNDSNLSLAMEYFKNSDEKLQLEIADYISSVVQGRTIVS